MGNGKRGVRPEGPFEPPTPLAGHMPAKTPRDQGDFGPSNKGGIHESDFSGNTTARPRELKPNVGDGGNFTFGAGKGTIESGSQDPRRSHS